MSITGAVAEFIDRYFPSGVQGISWFHIWGDCSNTKCAKGLEKMDLAWFLVGYLQDCLTGISRTTGWYIWSQPPKGEGGPTGCLSAHSRCSTFHWWRFCRWFQKNSWRQNSANFVANGGSVQSSSVSILKIFFENEYIIYNIPSFLCDLSWSFYSQLLFNQTISLESSFNWVKRSRKIWLVEVCYFSFIWTV